MIEKSTNRYRLTLGVLTIVMLGASCTTTLTPSQRLRRQAMHASPQWSGDGFKNNIPQADSSLWSMIAKSIGNDAQTTPNIDLPVKKLGADSFVTTPRSGLRITWLGHSSVLIEIDGHRVLTDPVWSDRVSPVSWVGPKRFFAPPLPIEALPHVDAVVISHDHFDHLDKETIVALRERVGRFVVPLGVGEYMEEWGVAPEKIVELDWWQYARVGRLKLVATPARHFSGRSLSFYANPTLWASWSIVGPEHRVFFSGDTAMFPGFAEIGERFGPFDVTLMETGAYDALWTDVHMGPEQAVQAHQMVRGKLMLPVHWGTFDLANHAWIEPAERVQFAAQRAGVSLAIPRPGESFEPVSPPAIAQWWPNIPWQTAKQAPIVSTGLSTVSSAALTRSSPFTVGPGTKRPRPE